WKFTFLSMGWPKYLEDTYVVFNQFQVFSYDGVHLPDSLAVTAAGIAITVFVSSVYLIQTELLRSLLMVEQKHRVELKPSKAIYVRSHTSFSQGKSSMRSSSISDMKCMRLQPKDPSQDYPKVEECGTRMSTSSPSLPTFSVEVNAGRVDDELSLASYLSSTIQYTYINRFVGSNVLWNTRISMIFLFLDVIC
ncbi:hypothetical protein Tco_0706956, partial [Tanacetum coccineum]